MLDVGVEQEKDGEETLVVYANAAGGAVSAKSPAHTSP